MSFFQWNTPKRPPKTAPAAATPKPPPQPPASEPPREKYQPLVTCLRTLEKNGTEDIAEILADNVESFDLEGCRNLTQMGFRKFAGFTRGVRSFALHTTQGQVLRFYIKLPDGQKSHIHEKLPSIIKGIIGGMEYEVLPTINTNVTKQDEQLFRSHLISKGYTPLDCYTNKGDLGYLPDGTIIAVDKECIATPKAAKMILPDDLPWLVKSDKESIFPYLHNTGYISKMEECYPALMDGRVRGILSDEDIERLKAGELETLRQEKPECFIGISTKTLPEFIHLVKEEGWYPSQAQEIMRERDVRRTLERLPTQGPAR